ncbi:MAG: hypothetical protein ACLUD2_20930 [Clostridium sp.]
MIEHVLNGHGSPCLQRLRQDALVRAGFAQVALRSRKAGELLDEAGWTDGSGRDPEKDG